MFDLGWAELLVIAAVAVLLFGPDEIPVIMRTLGRAVRRMQYVRFALSRQFDSFMQDHDLDELRRSLKEDGAAEEPAQPPALPSPPEEGTQDKRDDGAAG